MPLLDEHSFSVDRPCVIIDIGFSLTKVGIAGESRPRAIFPSVAGIIRVHENSPLPKNLRDYKDKAELRKLLVDFFQEIFFHYLLVNPKERNVLMVESVLCPIEFKSVVSDVLFNHFEVPSLLFAPGHLLALFTLGIQTGLVLDCGYTESLVLPVYEGISVLKAWQAAPLGGAAVHRSLREQLLKRAQLQEGGSQRPLTAEDSELLTEKVLEDVKVRGCFVTTLQRALAYRELQADLPEAQAPTPAPTNFSCHLDGSRALQVSGEVRELACEVLFELDNDEVSVATLLLDALLLCPLDIRRPLAENLVVIGGTSMLPGFLTRLKAELHELLKLPKYSSSLNIPVFKFHNPPGKRNFVAWLGGAIFGALEVLSVRALPRERYLESGLVPDWSQSTGTDSDCFVQGLPPSQRGLERK